MTTNALEKGHTMKKIFALACATSALAIVSTANAGSGSLGISTGDQFSVTIKGTVPGYCTLSSPGTFNVSNGTYTPSGNKNGTFDIANLGNAGGLVQEWTATGSFQITANESCNLSLISTNGGLKNTSNSSASNINYSAVVYDSQSSATPVVVPAAPNTAFSGFSSKFDPVTLGNETINLGVSISSGSAPVAAGTYQDVLTLIVNPTI
jgi:hypothetical protein